VCTQIVGFTVMQISGTVTETYEYFGNKTALESCSKPTKHVCVARMLKAM